MSGITEPAISAAIETAHRAELASLRAELARVRARNVALEKVAEAARVIHKQHGAVPYAQWGTEAHALDQALAALSQPDATEGP